MVYNVDYYLYEDEFNCSLFAACIKIQKNGKNTILTSLINVFGVICLTKYTPHNWCLSTKVNLISIKNWNTSMVFIF